jgi:ComF family protein
LRRAIATLKYNNQPQIAYPLGQWMGQGWLDATKLRPSRSTSKTTVVVPIPMHPAKQRKRGYNQAELLAQGFCQVTGLALQAHGLERIKETDAQFSLSADDRAKNLADAFTVSRELRRRSSLSVLILDDIYTTGATVKSAIQAFQQQHILVAGLVVLARTQKQTSP